MNQKKVFFLILFLPLVLIFTASCNRNFGESDTESFQLVSFYDLRERESFVQITNTASTLNRVHVQVFDVGNNCNENNFFDNLTGNDTHVYNLRNIQTNDGNPSGIVLPDGAYGIVVITTVDPEGNAIFTRDLIGNFRAIDNSGFEYRTNSLGLAGLTPNLGEPPQPDWIGKYDVVLCCGVFTLGHVEANAIENLIPLCRPGGILLVSTRTSYYQSYGYQQASDALIESSQAELVKSYFDAPYTDDGDAHYWLYRKP